jgi:hypothetical protein
MILNEVTHADAKKMDEKFSCNHIPPYIVHEYRHKGKTLRGRELLL